MAHSSPASVPSARADAEVPSTPPGAYRALALATLGFGLNFWA